MRNKSLISSVGRLREKANKYILDELKKNGISNLAPSHGDILFLLYNKERVAMKEVAEKINKDKSTVTALVNKLLKQGYIAKEKDMTDHRVSYILLTDKGKELKPIFFSISDKLFEKVYHSISDKEGEILGELLNRIIINW